MGFRLQRGLLAGLVLAGVPQGAWAQRAGDNVTTQSSDAFGRSVGNEKSGLYTTDDVRGFNPVDAGNVRIEGLYFDQIDKVSTRLIDGNAIRVGVAALHYPFPAPTGLVDYGLTQPRDKPSYSFNIDNGSTSSLGIGGSFEFKQPLGGGKWGIGGGFGFRNLNRTEGGHGLVRTIGTTLAWRPDSATEVLLFAGDFIFRSEEARPTLFVSGTAPPPAIERGVDLGQQWSGRRSDTWLVGAIAKTALGSFRLESGLFFTRRDMHQVFADLFTGVAADGSAAMHKLVADRGSRDSSLSGEVRLVREWKGEAWQHRLIASLRGRAKNRLFGGSQTLAYGPASLFAADLHAEPVYAFGPKNTDRVRQMTVGLAYGLASKSGFTLDAGISRSTYRKAIDFADPLLGDPLTRDRPLTWNLAASYAPARWLTLYAGITRGQEEALVAPDVAVNRSEAPAAIRTRQVEGGVRLALSQKLTMVLGGFEIAKPYYNLDPALRYRQLGELHNRGIELSLTGQLRPGLTLVAGTLLLDPRIEGEAVTSHLIGPRPVGQIRRRSALNLDWRSGEGKGALSFDLALESLSSRVGNAANSVNAPPRTTVNLGARYRFAAAGGHWLIRPLVQNLFDNYGWNVSTSGGWTYNAPRALTVQLVGDF